MEKDEGIGGRCDKIKDNWKWCENGRKKEKIEEFL